MDLSLLVDFSFSIWIESHISLFTLVIEADSFKMQDPVFQALNKYDP